MPTIQVRCWSKAAARLFPPEQVVLGRVHTCYTRIINLHTPDRRFVTLQGEGRLQAPLALVLATDVATLGARLPVGAFVVQDVPAAAAYPEAIRLGCTDVPVWDGQLQACAAWTPPRLASRGAALATWLTLQAPTCGLAPLLPALEHGATGLSATCTALSRAVMPLYTAPQTFSTATLLSLVRDLVGLGEGLTPAGDDFLVGLLAILHVTGWLSSDGASDVREQFLQCVRLGTSQLSGEFLRCAWEGHFAAPVADLIRTLNVCCIHAWPVRWRSLGAPRSSVASRAGLEPGVPRRRALAQDLRHGHLLGTQPSHTWQECASRLAAVGHSSGVDAMAGIVFGCQLLASHVS